MKHRKSIRILSALLALTLLLAIAPPLSLAANAAETSGKCGDNLTWSYNESTKRLTITGSGEMTDWTIWPENPPWHPYQYDIQSVSLPRGLMNIGDCAFNQCYNLSSVVIPDGVTSIGQKAFADCYYLAEISIPDSVTSIGSYAFWSSGMTALTIPSGVTSIGEDAIKRCFALKSITVKAGNPTYCSVNGVLFDANQTRLICCPSKKEGTYQVPGTVTVIENEAFFLCSELTELSIPDSVTSIGDSAFCSCRSLTELIIPDSVTGSLDGTFANCEGLKRIKLSNNVSKIGIQTFFSCSGLSEITIPDSVTSIGFHAFEGCSSLTSITIPRNVTDLGDHIIEDCSNLKAIDVDAENDSYCSVDGVLFNKDKTKLIQFPTGRSGAYQIPSGVEIIGDGAFENARGLEYVSIPASVTYFDWSVFSGCGNLRTVYGIKGSEAESFANACGIQFREIGAEDAFWDVLADAYYFEPVAWAVEKNITTGTSQYLFSPEATCTRAQVVTFLWRAAGSPEPKSNANPFADVAANQYYYKAVLWAVENGVTTGTSADRFSPDSGCTRAQVVTFLWRAEGKPAPKRTLNPFKDVDAREYYGTAVAWAVENGITNGTSADKFSPASICTRAQVVTFLYRAEHPSDNRCMVGVVLVGDENEAYSYVHIHGIETAMEKLGIDKNTEAVWKYCISEDASCYDAIADCIDQGCNIVFTNAYGHQSYAKQQAEENPNVQIVALTGDFAKKAKLPNFHNASTEIYEARYAAGVVAGMKIAELADTGKLSGANYAKDGTVKVGYVGAYPYAEVVSGYTAFFLGIKSVYENVSMEVLYTKSWFDITAENEAAVKLIADGCVIIGQHSDSTGAPSACEAALKAGITVYSVGFNVDMLNIAPTASLTSPTSNWEAYYEYALSAMLRGEPIATDWAEGFDKDAVALTELGSSVASGTREAVDRVIANLKAGKLHVFDTSTFTVGRAPVTSAFATDTNGDFIYDADEAIFDGYYHECYFRSAPSFSLRIDGITELN